MPSGITGGALTREQTVEVLFTPLEAASVVLQAIPGGRIFDADGGAPIRIPRITALTLGDVWRSENTQLPEVDPTYDQLVLLPSTLKALKVLHRLSNELVRLAAGNVEQLVGSAFVAAIAREWDKAALVGDGAADTVLGIANQTGVQVMAAVGSPTVDDLMAAEGLALAANADPDSLAWFMHARDFSTLRRQRDGSGGAGTGQYLITPDVTEPGKMRMLGHTVYIANGIPTNGGAGTNESSIILAGMDQVAVGRDLEARLDVLKETFGHFDQLALRVVMRADIGLINPEAVVVMNGVTP